MHELVRSQVVGGDLGSVFAFFREPANLERITPAFLHFRIESITPGPVQVGTRIGYRLRLHSIPIRWVSRIAEFGEGVRHAFFADEQLRGPYRRWYHRHEFTAVPEGVRIDDRVEYELPLGPVGRAVHHLVVRHQLAAIFDHRARVIAARFPRIGRPAPVEVTS
jgi:ligand-binding SRPBCC domain-containing protein